MMLMNSDTHNGIDSLASSKIFASSGKACSMILLYAGDREFEFWTPRLFTL
jgi:hypothetical protein